MAQGGSIIPTNLDFDKFMALLESFCAELVKNFEENFFFVLFHFVVGGYGHIAVEQTYAVELKALEDNLVFRSRGQLSIDPDPFQNGILYPYDTIPEDEPESSSEEDESDDNSRDNNGNYNDTVENGDKSVQSNVEGMLKLVSEDAMYPEQDRESINCFDIRHGENIGILVTTSGHVR